MYKDLYVLVAVAAGGNQQWWYRVNKNLQDTVSIGSFVRVPLQRRTVYGCVVQLQEQQPAVRGIKSILSCVRTPADFSYFAFLKQVAAYYQISINSLIERLVPFFDTPTSIEQGQVSYAVKPYLASLTLQQQHIVDELYPFVQAPSFMPAVLHGVTGSGKTEVYRWLVHQVISAQKAAMLLLPEVTLAIEFEKKFKETFGSTCAIFSYHSATSTKERQQLWQALLRQQPILIIGVHLPIFLPIGNLGMIIVDEEHEVGYQEKKHPKINSKEMAIARARCANVPILLGSATPSIATLYNIKKRGWRLFQLKERFAGSFAQVTKVLLPHAASRAQFWISRELQQAIVDRLQKKEQVMLFLNRRGFSFFVQCSQCSFVARCVRCSVSLTVHEQGQLICHYCGYTQADIKMCPECKANEHKLIKKGIGTQQLVTILKKMFPHAIIARADLDTTSKKKIWQQIVHNFAHGAIDILVGTQSIAKGYDFKGVTLVGVVWADINMNMPIFNASETTLQQLIQVGGRAGRFAPHSQVIVQSMADHPIFSYINEVDYLSFYETEVATRQELWYPPHARLVEIELKHSDEQVIEKEAQTCALLFSAVADHMNLAVQVLGPAKPPVYQIKKIYMRKIYLKCMRIDDAIALYQAACAQRQFASSLFFTPNPVT